MDVSQDEFEALASQPDFKPAARVIRSSKRPEPKPSMQGREEKDRSDVERLGQLAIGNIVERKRTKKKKRMGVPKPNRNGFPSYSRPVGSLVQRESSKSQDAPSTSTALSGMFPEEIEDSIAEVQSILSPQSIAFLKERGKKKLERTQPCNPNESKSGVKDNYEEDTELTPEKEQAEKERLAELLASIQTYEDLDEAVGHGPPSEKPTFQTACNLLRSSSRRQQLWAAKTVSEKLKLDVDKRIVEGGVPKEYPPLLPVSLRCLLDVPSSQWMLQALALDSMYSLLQLLCSSDYLYIDREDEWQSCFLDDTIEVPPVTYTSDKVKAISVEAKPVAYATESTTQTAESDGDAFYRDPLWTLVSRMRLLPVLARISPSKEALTAATGILYLLCQRARGVATAIAQQTKLLERWSDVPGAKLQVAKLKCILSRQSKVAASELSFSAADYAKCKGNYEKQKWLLILWRIRLRYALSIEELPTMLDLSLEHIELGPHRESLAAEFLSCFRACLNCFAPALASDDRASPSRTMDILDRAIPWFVSAQRSILSQLKLLFDGLDQGVSEGQERYVCCAFRFLVLCAEVSALTVASKRDNDEAAALTLNEPNAALCTDFIRALVCNVEWTNDWLPKLSNSQSKLARNESNNFLLSAALFDASLHLLTTLARVDNNISIDAQNITTRLHEVAVLLSDTHIFQATCRRAFARVTSSVIWCLSKMLPCASGNKSVTLALLSLLGKLHVGEESVAIRLLSCDGLLQYGHEAQEAPSPISTVLIRQLCLGKDSLNQLDHSFKLHGGLGVADDGQGPYALNSLLSITERNRSGSEKRDTHLLPLGDFWLWKLLAGKTVDETSDESFAVINNVLDLTQAIEFPIRKSDSTAGAFVYYLMNMCLQTEKLLSDSAVTKKAAALLEQYSFNSTNATAGFAKECSQHARAMQNHKVDKLLNVDTNGLADKWEKSWYDAVNTFLDDLCNVFLAFGAQYGFFGRCLRLFLSSYMPSRVRCFLLQRLRGSLHLLSVDGEVSRDMAHSIFHLLGEDMTDPWVVVESALSALSEVAQRQDSLFVQKWAVATIARNLGSSFIAQTDSSSTETRVAKLNTKQQSEILRLVRSYIKGSNESGFQDFWESEDIAENQEVINFHEDITMVKQSVTEKRQTGV